MLPQKIEHFGTILLQTINKFLSQINIATFISSEELFQFFQTFLVYLFALHPDIKEDFFPQSHL